MPGGHSGQELTCAETSLSNHKGPFSLRASNESSWPEAGSAEANETHLSSAPIIQTFKPPILRRFLDTLAQLAFIAAALALTYAAVHRPLRPTGEQNRPASPKRTEPPLPSAPLSLEGAIVRGRETARIVLIVYSDFECPFCSKFAQETLPSLEKKYVSAGTLLLAFRHFPLPSHSRALIAAEAAECAGREGKFWEMHDLLFQDRRRLADKDLRTYANRLGLDRKGFDACLLEHALGKVQTDVASGRALGITGTPSFFLGTLEADGRVRITRRLSGARPLPDFEAAIDSVLKQPGE